MRPVQDRWRGKNMGSTKDARVGGIPVPHVIAFFNHIIDELHANIRCIDVTAGSTTPAKQAFRACELVPRHNDVRRVCVLTGITIFRQLMQQSQKIAVERGTRLTNQLERSAVFVAILVKDEASLKRS